MGRPAEVRRISAQRDREQRQQDDKNIAVAEEVHRTGFNGQPKNSGKNNSK